MGVLSVWGMVTFQMLVFLSLVPVLMSSPCPSPCPVPYCQWNGEGREKGHFHRRVPHNVGQQTIPENKEGINPEGTVLLPVNLLLEEGKVALFFSGRWGM